MVVNAWTDLLAAPVFPGRGRTIGARIGGEHAVACDALALAFAVGAAQAEQTQGGVVVVAAADPDAAWWEAAAYAGRISPAGLVLAAGPGIDAARLAACGWTWSTTPISGSGPVAVACSAKIPPSRAALTRPWMPVDLVTLGRACTAPWPTGAGPAAQARAALDWLSARESALRIMGGSGWPSLAAAAQLGCEGHRTVWWAEPGHRWHAGLLDSLGRDQLPVVMLVAPGNRPVLPAGWWLAEPADSAETSAVLAWVLGDGAPWCVVLPESDAGGLAPWPADGTWEPGQVRARITAPA